MALAQTRSNTKISHGEFPEVSVDSLGVSWFAWACCRLAEDVKPGACSCE